ncbi:MAG TPA: hypothetical protein VGE77_04925 [Nocardioides sp.]
MSDWSYSGYLSTYDDFVAKLTELRQIDLVLDILEDTPDYYGGPGQYRLEVDLGTTYPFTERKTISYSSHESVEARINATGGEASTWANGIFSGMDDKVDFIVGSMPSTVQYSLEQMRTAAGFLDGIGNDGDIGHLRTKLSDWTGSAKEDFMVFHSTVTSAAANQARFLTGAAAYVELTATIAKAGQLDLYSYIQALESMADDQLKLREQNSRAQVDGDALSAIAAFSTAAAAIPGPQQAAVVGFTLVITLASIAANANETVPMTSSSAADLGTKFTTQFDGVVTEVNSLLADVDTQATALREMFDIDYPDRLYPPSPGIDDSTGTGDLRHNPT